MSLHAPGDAFTVFAQRTDARIEIDAWALNAVRFFATRVELAPDSRREDPPAREQTASVLVTPRGRAAGSRTCHGRPRTDDDLARALDAERRVGSAGLGDLARRCGYVWLVGCEGVEDPLALLLAAILASVVLGPIVSPGGTELFGVKTARIKLGQ